MLGFAHTSLLVLPVLVVSAARACGAQRAFPESASSLLRALVTDSVSAGGANTSGVFVAADSSSASLLRQLQIPLDSTQRLVCPGSTDKDGLLPAGANGYRVRLTIVGATDTLEVSVLKACTFVYRGRPHGFYQEIVYEVSRRQTGWHARPLRMSIT